MNTDNPNDGGNGDYETIPNLRKKYAFCAEENIITARCYKAGTNITHDHTGETVSCDRTGLKCNNWEQLNQSSGKCSDYSIRFYCNCKFSEYDLVNVDIHKAHRLFLFIANLFKLIVLCFYIIEFNMCHSQCSYIQGF